MAVASAGPYASLHLAPDSIVFVKFELFELYSLLELYELY